MAHLASTGQNHCAEVLDQKTKRLFLRETLGHVLYRYFDIPIDRQDRPALRRYYDALTERPTFREHVMIPYEELRVTD